jgi:hypothetical protein
MPHGAGRGRVRLLRSRGGGHAHRARSPAGRLREPGDSGRLALRRGEGDPGDGRGGGDRHREDDHEPRDRPRRGEGGDAHSHARTHALRSCPGRGGPYRPRHHDRRADPSPTRSEAAEPVRLRRSALLGPPARRVPRRHGWRRVVSPERPRLSSLLPDHFRSRLGDCSDHSPSDDAAAGRPRASRRARLPPRLDRPGRNDRRTGASCSRSSPDPVDGRRFVELHLRLSGGPGQRRVASAWTSHAGGGSDSLVA